MSMSINNKTNINMTLNKKDLYEDTLVDDTINEYKGLNIDTTKLEELFIKYIVDIDIKHPEVAYGIAKQESAFRSRLFKSNNNLFGMRHPKVRPTKSLGNKLGFAHFENWQHSVDDYKLYIEFCNGHKMSKKQFLSYIKNNYANSNYVLHISKHFNEFYVLKDKIFGDTID